MLAKIHFALTVVEKWRMNREKKQLSAIVRPLFGLECLYWTWCPLRRQGTACGTVLITSGVCPPEGNCRSANRGQPAFVRTARVHIYSPQKWQEPGRTLAQRQVRDGTLWYSLYYSWSRNILLEGIRVKHLQIVTGWPSFGWYSAALTAVLHPPDLHFCQGNGEKLKCFPLSLWHICWSHSRI